MRKSFWFIVIISTLYLCVVSYTMGNYWAFKKYTKLFIEEQCELNASMTRIIVKMSAAIQHNYDFSNSNKALIQNVAELYVPDEVALLRRIHARQ